MKTDLVIVRGLPGSGKSTWAAQWVAEDPAHRAEVNRDHLRVMMHGGFADQEVQVTVARDAAIEQLLKRGISVVSSDTSLPQRTARDLVKIAVRAGAGWTVMDLTGVPLETCLGRNATRTDKAPVPEEYIREKHRKFIAPLKGRPLPLPEDKVTRQLPDLYVPVPHEMPCVIADIDGTVALMEDRFPYDYSKVHLDRPNWPVVEALHSEYTDGREIVFMSGRDDSCREATRAWLEEWMPFRFTELHMRKTGDKRDDAIVKRELFDEHVRFAWDVKRVYDDRNRVVSMWRDVLGLTCLQVAAGCFLQRLRIGRAPGAPEGIVPSAGVLRHVAGPVA